MCNSGITSTHYVRNFQSVNLACLGTPQNLRDWHDALAEAGPRAFRTFVAAQPVDWGAAASGRSQQRRVVAAAGGLSPQSLRHLFAAIGAPYGGLLEAGYLSVQLAGGGLSATPNGPWSVMATLRALPDRHPAHSAAAPGARAGRDDRAAPGGDVHGAAGRPPRRAGRRPPSLAAAPRGQGAPGARRGHPRRRESADRPAARRHGTGGHQQRSASACAHPAAAGAGRAGGHAECGKPGGPSSPRPTWPTPSAPRRRS